MNKVQMRKGVTLLALVITIIVMLLLAAVTIQMTLGENGLVNKANTAKEESEYNEAKDRVRSVVLKLGLEINSKDANIGLDEIEKEIQKDTKLTYTKTADKISVASNGYEFEIEKNLGLKAVGKKQEIISKGHDAGTAFNPGIEEEDEDDTEWGAASSIDPSLFDDTNNYDKLKNVFDYSMGARITYITNPYSGGNMRAINGGNTGNDSPIGNTNNYFWRDSNGWNNQGAVENDASIDNIQRLHKNSYGKSSSSATTMSGHNLKRTIIIDPRAYHGDTQNYTFEVDDLYMSSANSDGNVRNYTIYISSGGPEVATDPNHSSWQQLKTGRLTKDGKLEKVHEGNIQFKYIKLDVYSENKSYTELAAIKGFKRIINTSNTELGIVKVNKDIKIVAMNYNNGIKQIKIVKPNGQQDIENYNNLAAVRKKYTLTENGKYKIIVVDKNGSEKEQEIKVKGI